MASDEKPIRLEGPVCESADVYERILRALPEWFGDEKALTNYVETIPSLPTFVAFRADVPVGFVTIKQHYEHAAEIYVLGVAPAYHRCGIGRRLICAAEEWLSGMGVEYLQVKTLSPAVPYEPYDRTRGFYSAMGFRPIEEFKELWNAENPCLLMLKRLDPASR